MQQGQENLRAALVALVAALALSAGGARADASYTDPSGDQDGAGAGAVDITTVHVSNTSTAVTFQITIRNPEVAASSFQFLIFVNFDLDKNPATPDSTGAEAQVSWERSSGLVFQRCNADACVGAPTSGMSAAFSGGVLTLTMPLAALGSVRSFGFLVGALNVPAPPGGGDLAPNESAGYWVYDVTSTVTLSASKPRGTPIRPVAGKAFTVSSVVKRSDTGAAISSGAVTCVTRAGATTIHAFGRFRAGRAQCTMTVPLAAKGKVLRGRMGVTALGTSVKTAFSFRVT